MTTSPRELLDVLGRGTLVRLIHERGLATCRENDERRETLARSYRGNVKALISEMNRPELIRVFRKRWFELGGQKFELRNPSKYRLEELRAFAVRAFAGQRVRIIAKFAPYQGDEDYECIDDLRPDDPAGDHDDDGRSNRETSEPRTPTILRGVTDEWSRPFQVARLMAAFGWSVPERLRTVRFQELLAELKQHRIEACLAGDPDRYVLDNRTESPGISSRLRLRGVSPDEEIEMDDENRGFVPKEIIRQSAVCKKTIVPDRNRPQIGDRGPSIVVQPGERPISHRAPRPPDYNLAMLRLRLLTAVPSVERQNMPQWPDEYVRAAAKGLTLRPQELALLLAYSASLCFGQHSPYDAIPQLTQALSTEEWQSLLKDFARLNPFEFDFVRTIVEQIQSVRTSHANTEAAPVPGDLLVQDPERRREALVAAPRVSSDSSGSPDQRQATNVRDLGALTGMFDEE